MTTGSQPSLKNSNTIEIEKVEVEPEEIPQEETPPEEKVEIPLPLGKKFVEITARTVGEVAYEITKLENARFTDDEIEQLSDIWSPCLPRISPLTLAILGTTVIIGGKVIACINERRTRKEASTGKTAQE